MDREQLANVLERFVKWSCTKPLDEAAFETIVSKDVIVRIPYPGCPPTFDGLLAITKKSHEAAPDFQIKIQETIVDVQQSRVIVLLQVTGTHQGYPFFCLVVNNISEWLGIPPTGKQFDVLGFIMVKVTLLRRLWI